MTNLGQKISRLVGPAIALLAFSTSMARTDVAPEEYINLTAISKRILLIDVTAKTLGKPSVKAGIEERDVTVEGTTIETLRGESPGPKFTHKGSAVRLVDTEQVRKTSGDEVVEILRRKNPHRSSLCVVGRRYLVIYFPEQKPKQEPIFYEVSKTDEKWRQQVVEYQRL